MMYPDDVARGAHVHPMMRAALEKGAYMRAAGKSPAEAALMHQQVIYDVLFFTPTPGGPPPVVLRGWGGVA